MEMTTGFMIEPRQGDINYKQELMRKGIHLSSMWIPITLWFVPRPDAVLILIVVLFFCMSVDLERSRPGPLGDLIRFIVNKLIRPHESPETTGRMTFTGASWMLMAAVPTYFFFSKPVATAAFAMLIVCDTAAALVGKKYGRVPFGSKGKSLEGAVACLVSGLIVILFTPGIPLWVGVFGALAATFAEACIDGVDDNFTIPLCSGLVMTLLLAMG